MQNRPTIKIDDQVYGSYEGTKVFGKVLKVSEFCITIYTGNNCHLVLDRDTVKKL